MTYIPTAQGWLYLAVVLDLKSRRVIGWGMSHCLEQKVVHDALEMALGQRPREETNSGCLFHSDRGSRVPSGRVRLMLIRRDWKNKASPAA